jgi:hypothetical protein
MKAFNYCVQATPDYDPLFIVAQVAGAPDAECWVLAMRL